MRKIFYGWHIDVETFLVASKSAFNILDQSIVEHNGKNLYATLNFLYREMPQLFLQTKGSPFLMYMGATNPLCPFCWNSLILPDLRYQFLNFFRKYVSMRLELLGR